MNKNFNFKIVGSGPTGLLLAITLSKLNFNIYLTDLLSREKLITKIKHMLSLIQQEKYFQNLIYGIN